MLSCFRKKNDSLKNNNKGMALVTVIVIIGFVAALVSIVLTTSLVNFKMKSLETKSKDTFYSAEQVLDEINVFLQKVVSDSMSDAYLDIMNNYATYDTKKKSELLEAKYYENIWKAIGCEDGPVLKSENYDVKKLEAYIKDTTIWHGDPIDGYGAIIMAEKDGAEGKVGKMTTYHDSGVVLEGLKVYYKDKSGFVSVVKTDIRLAYPKFDFASSSELPRLPFYSIVADKKLDVYPDSAAVITGNIYANQLNIAKENNNKNISVKLGDKEDSLTVKYDININPHVTYKSGEDNVIWASNIVVDSSTVELDGTVQVYNDMNLTGRHPSATVTGEYVGFGYNPDNSYKSSAILINGLDSKVNMNKLKKLTLLGRSFFETSDSEFGDKKVLYKGAEEEHPYYFNNLWDSAEEQDSKKKNDDIKMGQSIAVKPDQLMYLVPAESIGVDENTKRSKYNKNPLTYSEYKDIMTLMENDKDSFDYVLVADDVSIASLDGATLNDYVARKEVTINGNKRSLPDVQKVFVTLTNDTNATGGGLVYFYMKFADRKANSYYEKYYNASEESLSNHIKYYLTDMKISDKTNTSVVAPMLVGNMSTASGYSVEAATIFDDVESLKKTGDKYIDKFTSMCSNLVASNDNIKHSYDTAIIEDGYAYEDESDDSELFKELSKSMNAAEKAQLKTDIINRAKKNQVVFDNLVDDDSLKNFINNLPMGDTIDAGRQLKFSSDGTTVKIYQLSADPANPANLVNVPGGPGAYISMSGDEFTITSSDTNLRLVITRGPVVVKKEGVITESACQPSFSGLILSDSTVTLESDNVVIEANPGEVRKALGWKYDSGDLTYEVASVLKEGSEFIYSSLDPKGDTTKLSLGNLITYENWSKE